MEFIFYLKNTKAAEKSKKPTENPNVCRKQIEVSPTTSNKFISYIVGCAHRS